MSPSRGFGCNAVNVRFGSKAEARRPYAMSAVHLMVDLFRLLRKSYIPGRMFVRRMNLEIVHTMGLTLIGDGSGRIDKQPDAGCNHQNPGGSWDEVSGRTHFLKKDQDHQASNPKQVHDSAYKE